MGRNNSDRTRTDIREIASLSDSWALVEVFSPTGRRATHRLRGEAATVRRSDTSSGPTDIVLDDSTVSRGAIGLCRTPERAWVIEDRGAHNPLRVNGQRAASAQLRHGDVLRIGRTVLVAERSVGHVGVDDGDEAVDVLCEGLLAGPSAATRALRLDAATIPTGGACLTVACPGPGEGRAAVAWMTERTGESPVLIDARDEHAAAAVEGAGAARFVAVDNVFEIPPQRRAALAMAIQRHTLAHADATVMVFVPHPAPDDSLVGHCSDAVLTLPPLSERRADIVPAFVELIAREAEASADYLHADLAELLSLYSWPKHLDELRAVARRAARLVQTGGALVASALSDTLADVPIERRASVDREISLDSVVRALVSCDGSVTRVAATFGCSRQHFYRRLAQDGIDIGAARSLYYQRLRESAT